MEDAYNVDPGNSKATKTSSTDGKSKTKTTAESEVQDGTNVVSHEVEPVYERSEDQQEYIEQSNNNTAVGNESPVKEGKGMTMSANISGSLDDDDDDENDDDNSDDPLTEVEIGDDPEESKKKIPVFGLTL